MRAVFVDSGGMNADFSSSPRYGRGFLIGRLDAFTRRGDSQLTHVRGAIGLASRCGVSDEDIADILRPYGLTWDAATDSVTRL